MAHLAALAGRGLAVQVQMRARQGQQLRPRRGAAVWPDVTQQIEHDAGAVLARLGEWQAGQGAYLQVKLRHIAGVDAVVAAVVRTWRHFVDHQATHRRAVLELVDRIIVLQDGKIVMDGSKQQILQQSVSNQAEATA